MSKRPPASSPKGRVPGGVSVRLFVSYSHQDGVWMERLKPIMSGFQYDDRLTGNRVGLQYVHAWHDKELKAGHPWDVEIKSELEAMDVFVPLVSGYFFSSWYIQNVELPKAKRRHTKKEVLVAPILLYETNLREKCEFLHKFSAYPKTDTWWSSYPDPAAAHRLIDDGLWAVIHEVVAKKLGRPLIP